jgi:hypothetical protein
MRIQQVGAAGFDVAKAAGAGADAAQNHHGGVLFAQHSPMLGRPPPAHPVFSFRSRIRVRVS